jgi:hypothetical protein
MEYALAVCLQLFRSDLKYMYDPEARIFFQYILPGNRLVEF